MAKVKFYLDKPQKASTYIILSLSYNGKRLRYSTGLQIEPIYWDTTQQRAKKTRKFREYPEFNGYLESIAAETNAVYLNYQQQSKVPSIKEFKAALDIFTNRTTAVKEGNKLGLFGFIDQFIQEREKLPNFRKRTIDYYNVMKGILEDYSNKKNKNRKLDFQDIDLTFYNDFLAYLYNDREFSINYAGNVIKTLKTFLNDATEKGINTNLAYKSKYFTKPKQETDNIYLNTLELKQIYDLDLSNNPRLDKVRDLFIIGAFTGLRFSDFTTIQPENITTIQPEKGKYIEVFKITTKKTDTPVIIPLHPYIKSILTKYNGETPPTITNQKLNDYLKEVAKLAGINKTIQLTTSKKGKRLDETFEKWEKVSSHTARRSFATNAFKAGISALSIMKITGHKTETAFMKYIKITLEENAAIMAMNPFFRLENKLKAV